MRGDARLGAIRLLLVLTLAILSKAGPVNRPGLGDENENSSRQSGELKSTNINEVSGCIFGAKKYILGENVPSIKKCEICMCTENGIQCLAQPCEIKKGCKALHRADNCCPLYQCECERNGVTYSNGEKLVDPENPCQVCYCQGGDIVCNPIACFIKNDCEPRYVPGQCCPEYDHCPPKEKLVSNSSRIESQTFDAKSEYETSSESISSHDDGEINNQEISFSGDRMDEEINLDENLNYSTDSPVEYSSIKNDNIPQINIKEVTYDKPLNNEIRIKEILPVESYDINSVSTKSPTFPREATYSSKEVEGDVDLKNFTDSENIEPYQTPPILRIGDQLLYLGQGNLVPENSSMNTPAPVFTVIGAEGLQRVIEDPEEFESKFVSEESHDDIQDNNIDKKNSNASFFEKSDDNDSSASLNVVENIATTSEDPEKILQEVISDLYETTTVEAIDNELKKDFNEIESKNETSELTASDSINSEQSSSLENESHTVPIDHLLEHNPEYPPIPEDITNFGLPEETSESTSSELEVPGAYPIFNQAVADDDEIAIVKRPVFPSQSFSNSIREKSPKDSEKILPEVLHIVEKNKVNSSENSTSFAPSEWLKVPESPVNVKSQLLSTEEIENVSLSTIYKESTEEDDSQDYIFIKKSNQDSSSNSHVRNYPSTSTNDNKQELSNSLDSNNKTPLVIGWDRYDTTQIADIINDIPQTTNDGNYVTYDATESTNDIIETTNSDINTGADLIIELNADQTEMLSNDTILINITFEKDEKEVISANKNEPTESQNIIVAEISSTENVITKEPAISISTDNSIIDENNSSNAIETRNESSDAFSEDLTENTISPTEDAILSSTTENILSNNQNPENLEVIETLVLNEDISSDAHNQKQKKTLVQSKEVKKEKPEKKGNILADLISLVGDVASIGDHETELSTVHNSIDSENEKVTQSFERSTSAPIVSTEGNKLVTDSGFNSAKVEITEDSISDKTDSPLESDKVEFTTKKTYIDSDSDERIKWKSTDSIKKDIELIPKVETKATRFPEKIVENEESEEAYSYEMSSSEDIYKPKEISLILTQTDAEPSTTTTTAPKTSAPKTKAPKTNTPKVINTTTRRPTSTIKTTSNSSKVELTTKKSEPKPASNTATSVESSEKDSPTVMKLSSKGDANKEEGKTGEKLTKRETNSQIVETTGQIDESLITILRNFFEKQYRH